MRLAGLVIAIGAGWSGAAAAERAPAGGLRTSSRTVLERMMRRYDDAASYRGEMFVALVTPDGTRRRLVRIAAQGNGRGWVLRSRVELYSVARDGSRSLQSLRIDDGKVLWTWLPGPHAYYRQRRQRDRLSRLLQPFIAGVTSLVPRMEIAVCRLHGRRVFRLFGREGSSQAVVYLTYPGGALAEGDVYRSSVWRMRLVVQNEGWNVPLDSRLFLFHPAHDASMLPKPERLHPERKGSAP